MKYYNTYVGLDAHKKEIRIAAYIAGPNGANSLLLRPPLADAVGGQARPAPIKRK